MSLSSSRSGRSGNISCEVKIIEKVTYKKNVKIDEENDINHVINMKQSNNKNNNFCYRRVTLMLHGRVTLMLHGRVTLMLHGRVTLMLHGRVTLMLHGRVTLMLQGRVTLMLHGRVTLMLQGRVTLMLQGIHLVSGTSQVDGKGYTIHMEVHIKIYHKLSEKQYGFRGGCCTLQQ